MPPCPFGRSSSLRESCCFHCQHPARTQGRKTGILAAGCLRATPPKRYPFCLSASGFSFSTAGTPTIRLAEMASGGSPCCWHCGIPALKGRSIRSKTILNRDRKEATYKLALFRALAEVATQEARTAVWCTNGGVGVPIRRIAELWLQYYWPLLASNKTIPQSKAEAAGGKPMKFRSSLEALIEQFAGQGIHGGLTSWHLALLSHKLEPRLASQLQVVLRSISETIRDGPVAYSGGALETGPVFRFDGKTKLIVMSAELWRELSLLGHWIGDAVFVRWAALTQKFAHRQGLSAGDVLPLLLARPEALRATALARQVFQAAGVSRCTWSDKGL